MEWTRISRCKSQHKRTTKIPYAFCFAYMLSGELSINQDSDERPVPKWHNIWPSIPAILMPNSGNSTNELPEIDKHLETLRQLLEDGVIIIRRATDSLTF